MRKLSAPLGRTAFLLICIIKVNTLRKVLPGPLDFGSLDQNLER